MRLPFFLAANLILHESCTPRSLMTNLPLLLLHEWYVAALHRDSFSDYSKGKNATGCP